jgi:hypothetical protein
MAPSDATILYVRVRGGGDVEDTSAADAVSTLSPSIERMRET